jgi:thymidylate synthase ThyX
MKVQHVGLTSPTTAVNKGVVSLTPELLAATGARYSRNNEGLETILSKIDWQNTDKSVDTIFRMVDYGHASIADMAPVAMFIDGVTIYLATYLWGIAPTASGQESSTRYIEYKSSSIPHAAELGVKPARQLEIHTTRCFSLYQTALDLWRRAAKRDPKNMGIPEEVLADTSEKGQKKLDRMIRNYAFDRARVFLPVCAKTNVMMIASARAWVEIISHLLSHPLPEAQSLGRLLREQLDLVTPRLTRHACFKQDVHDVIIQSLRATQKTKPYDKPDDGAWINLFNVKLPRIDEYCRMRTNRYSPFGQPVRMLPVHFGWRQIGFAEMRDLNRHRTGNKSCDYYPHGFHLPIDQSPHAQHAQELVKLAKYAEIARKKATTLLHRGDWTYVYFLMLGHTVGFSHVTTLDKFIYEAELRTGVGAHYRYAFHLKNCLRQLYTTYPRLKGIIFEGSAEPE